MMYAYLVNMFSGLHKIFSDNGTDFKNKLFTQVASTLGLKQVFIPLFSSRKWVH